MDINTAINTPTAITKLESVLPGAMWLGAMDFARTFHQLLMARSPEGWVYIPAKSGSKTESALRAKAKQQGRNIKISKKARGSWVKSATVKGHDGTLKGSWQVSPDMSLKTISISNPIPYAPILESGGYPNPPTGRKQKNTPWTPWRVDGGFSKGAPGGLIGPLVEDKETMQRIIDLIVSRLDEVIRSAAIG